MTYALSASDLSKRYRSTWALRGCDLALPAGRVIALVGPNGAGKTTFLRLAVGLLAPTSGTIEVFGSSATTNTPQALARIGFLAQEHPLYRGFTVAELLRFGSHLNVRFDRGLAEKRLAALDIPLDRKAGTLSGGQQSQVLAMDFRDRAGNTLDEDAWFDLTRAASDTGQPFTAYLEGQGIQRAVCYHPGDRFWDFQLIEAGLFAGASVLLVALVVWRVKRRSL